MTPSDETGPTLVIRRLLPVPRQQVFAAWLDPASIAQWMLPGDTGSVQVELEPRVGGKFRIVMIHAGGGAEHRGEYLRIEPPSLLSFTWISAHTDFTPTIVTIELSQQAAGTELVLTHRRLPPAEVDAHRRGWTDIVRKLEGTLAAGRAG